METQVIRQRFKQMGADLKIIEQTKLTAQSVVNSLKDQFTRAVKWSRNPRLPDAKTIKAFVKQELSPKFKIDIKGGRFEIEATKDANIQVLDLDKAGRHLLLMANSNRFLCGHDERQWFTCAVPGNPKNVFEAKQALKPRAVVEAEKGVSKNKLQKRHLRINGGKRHRQGEFFFTPMPELHFERTPMNTILRKERIGQGGHPHIADELVRPRGRQVWLMRGRVLSEREYEALNDAQKRLCRSQMMVDLCYVRGNVRHEEHATLSLGSVWHAVTRNTEKSADGSISVGFVD